MTDPSPPAWVRKRDGRLVPFEPDRISRALFAAAEAAGTADAFLARELADGVVHFLCRECEGATPTTEQVAEVVVKVVRELGQPALAEAFAAGQGRKLPAGSGYRTEDEGRLVLPFTPSTALPELLRDCARAYSLRAVFARDLVAAHHAGLLLLTGLEAPGELAGSVPGPPGDETDLAGALAEARATTAALVALDGLEDWPAPRGPAGLVAALLLGLRCTSLRAVLNLNTASPPPWADALAAGPLFHAAPVSKERGDRADDLLAELLRAAPGPWRVDWHLSAVDFRPERRLRLLRLARLALEGAPLAFVFDRPRRPVALAEGLHRQAPATLLTVGLHLPALASQPGTDDGERFLRRLGSLARLALSAAVQKRDHLRRLERARPAGAPAVTRGFLLDRARLVAAPLGLERAAARFAGGPELVGRALQRLREVLREGRAAQLEACMDGPFDQRLEGSEEVAGPAPAPRPGPVRDQLRATGEEGTLGLTLPEEGAGPEQVAEWLHLGWRSEVVRLRLLRPSPTQREMRFEG